MSFQKNLRGRGCNLREEDADTYGGEQDSKKEETMREVSLSKRQSCVQIKKQAAQQGAQGIRRWKENNGASWKEEEHYSRRRMRQ